MSDLRIGSLCSGYGGLDMAVQQVIGGTVAWHCESAAAPSKILAHHWPEIPNHHDLTTTDWSSVEPVDVLTGGYPCQPFSHAGKRKGTNDERHIWPHIADAVRILRPRLLCFENVAGHVSLGLDVVLGDLAALGYDARWGCLRAADVGAPHGRERVFIAATDARRDAWQGDHQDVGTAARDRVAAAHSGGERHGSWQDGGAVGRVDSGGEGEAQERQRVRAFVGGGNAALATDTRGEAVGLGAGLRQGVTAGIGRMMGARPSRGVPTSPPSDDGSSRLYDLLPGQPRWDLREGSDSPPGSSSG
jgi:DNA (cytosine-5)-methyltransferase 1